MSASKADVIFFLLLFFKRETHSLNKYNKLMSSLKNY